MDLGAGLAASRTRRSHALVAWMLPPRPSAARPCGRVDGCPAATPSATTSNTPPSVSLAWMARGCARIASEAEGGGRRLAPLRLLEPLAYSSGGVGRRLSSTPPIIVRMPTVMPSSAQPLAPPTITRRRFAGAGPFRLAQVAVAVLHRAGEVGMAGRGTVKGWCPSPVAPVAVLMTSAIGPPLVCPFITPAVMRAVVPICVAPAP